MSEPQSGLKLNPAQKKAVQHKAGPLLIIAGAGTGKTRVITERIKWLVDQKLATAEEILALTFTQKAAQEMEERVDVAMPYGYGEMWISTFHSFCDRILKQEAMLINLDPSFTLMTQAQEYLYFRSKLFEFPLDRLRPKGNPTKFIGEILKHFSRLADEDVDPEQYEKFLKKLGSSPQKPSKEEEVQEEQLKDFRELLRVYKLYSDMKEKDGKFGFSDLVPYTLQLFRKRSDVLERYKKQFKYILVDEFQDTNHVQNELVKLLAGENGNITVVGDDDQAIYKFRGAAISNILDFKKSFPKYKKVVLTKNYRSDQKILDKAYELIKNNDPDRLEVTEKIDKKLVSAGSLSDPAAITSKSHESDLEKDQIGMSLGSLGDGDAVQRIHAKTDIEEAENVAEEIKKLVKNSDCELSDIAILVRANNHSAPFVEALRHAGIHYTFPGPKGLYNRPEIKDLMSFLHLLENYSEDAYMHRILTVPFGKLSPREYIDLQKLARKKRMSIFELLEDLTKVKIGSGKNSRGLKGPIAPDLMKSPIAKKLLKKESLEWITKLMKIFDDAFRMVKSGKNVGEVLYMFVTEIGYFDELIAEEKVSSQWKAQNISKFFDVLKTFERETEEPTVFSFLEYMQYSLEIGEDPGTEPLDLSDINAVNILTVHGAKGLEFPVVFMVNLVSQRFPTRRRSDVLPIPDEIIKETLPEGDEHLQEERRLFYVGMTRAEKRLYLTSADYYGDGIRKKKQSAFLYDIDMIVESPKPEEEKEHKKLYKSEKIDDMDAVSGDLNKSFYDNLIRNLSYSQISSYQSCPYQFYFKYFLRIPGAESQARSFGMTVHNTLKEFYERIRRFNQGLPEVEKMPTVKDLIKIYESKWQSGGYENDLQEKERFEKGKESLKKYHEKFVTGKENPIWLEQKFRVKLGDFWMKGTVDRMDKGKDGLEIIDYKTGKTPKDDKKIKTDLQLPIYVLAAEQNREEKVENVSLLYVEGPEKFTVKVGEEMKQKVKKEISEVLGEIKRGNYEANPGPLCKFCDYKQICDYAQI